jgi:hypothetical protein
MWFKNNVIMFKKYICVNNYKNQKFILIHEIKFTMISNDFK